MNRCDPRDRDQQAAILFHALTDVISDLQNYDPVDLVSFIRFGRFTAIDDLIQSSTELFFQDGTVNFGWTASTDVRWQEAPAVTLGLEFRYGGVCVFFDLTVRCPVCSISIVGAVFDPECPDGATQTARLQAGLTSARRQPRSSLRHPTCKKPPADRR